MTRTSTVRVWSLILLSFPLATALQLFIYAPVWGGQRLWSHAPDVLYGPLFLFFLLGPAVLATGTSLRLLYSLYRSQGSAPPLQAVFVVVMLAITSCVAGVLIAFNTWGT